ncbi:MAG: siphovirus Gp157 family protein [Alphaproteobacteria bacterium]|nr:siphovirus Gp157 family protein [Alphaproteobacteria bacterium]
MTDSSQKPELDDYDIKAEFKNLLFKHMELTKDYDHLILEIQELIDGLDSSAQQAFYDILNNYDMEIEDKKKHIAKMWQDFARFDKLYFIGKLFNHSYYETEQQVLNMLDAIIPNIKTRNDIKKGD